MPKNPLDDALQSVPKKFRDRLVQSYVELKRNCAESRIEAAGLSAGKFCEVALRFLQNATTSSHIAFGKKIPNFADECRKIINGPVVSATESERTIIPRGLVFLYTMRNKRGIGHVGGDIDANSIDIALMARVADWIIAELIRVHHGLSLEEAQEIVDAIAVRPLPEVWNVGGKKRVLRDGLSAKDETLLLLYSARETIVYVEDLIAWIEYSNPTVYKSNVLSKQHKARMLDWDRESDTVVLSPKGVQYVEEHVLDA